MRPLLALVPALAILAACATGPEERIARAEFQCENGRKLKVAFNLDQGAATVRIDKSKAAPIVLAAQNPGGKGRNYAAEGYSLVGVGDEVTWAADGAPTVCRETR